MHRIVVAAALCLSLGLAAEETLMDRIININMARGLRVDLVEGDIKLPPGQINQPRGGTVYESWRWPEGRIPFVIDPMLDEATVNAIYQAKADYDDFTCLKWLERTTETSYIYFTDAGGCWSYVGYIGYGPQNISLGPGCEVKRIAIHEMMHAAGFYHTQNRYDRDLHVTFHPENCWPGAENNFLIYGPDEIDLYGTYDVHSVMHYGCYGFSSNGKPTLSRNGDPDCKKPVGQPVYYGGLRSSDIYKLNEMYCPK